MLLAIGLVLLPVATLGQSIDSLRSVTGCAYRHPVACAVPHVQEFLNAWRDKTKCWLCDNGLMVGTANVLIKEIFSKDLGLTNNREITQGWLDTCLSAYALALFTTTRSTQLQSWRFYEFAMNMLSSCRFDDAVFYEHYGVTATQLHYVFFLLSYTTRMQVHSVPVQSSEYTWGMQLAIASGSTLLEPSPPWTFPLVVDIGMGLGADTRYYLSQGFRVLSVEANPKAVQTATMDKYTMPYLTSGQLTFLNAAIVQPGKGGGSLPFFPFSTRPEQSNSEQWMKEQGIQPMLVRTIECSDLVRIFGQPVYLKIDIESNSINCVESLHHMHMEYLSGKKTAKAPTLPYLISMEVEAPGIVPHFQRLLLDMGYDSYKVCRQYIYSPAPCEQGSYGVEVPGCGSGPFGEAAVDYRRGAVWADLKELANDTGWVDEFLNGLDWFDVHVRHGSAPPARGLR